MDRPSLEAAVLYTILAGLCFVVAAYLETGWLMWLLTIIGAATVFAAVIGWGDVIAYRAGIRIREIKGALTWDQVQLAYAVKGLTQAQTDYVERQAGQIQLLTIPGDPSPLELVRCLSLDVPKLYVEDFFRASAEYARTEGAPYLYPVRDGRSVGGGDGWSRGVEFAQALTNTIVSQQWAERAAGNNTAILTAPLEDVAYHFGVSL